MGRGAIVAGLDLLYRSGTLNGLTDGQLLARYAERGDPLAFEAIVGRHGGLVLGVCRGMLHDPNDAADAFQATFLVLVRKAGSVRVADTLGPWLHGVAYRVASRARANASRRQKREPTGLGADLDRVAGPVDQNSEALTSLLDEMSRLAERLRAPIVLCHLEGMTHECAAERLGCPVGTVRSRLARGRALLKDRLLRRGVSGPESLGALGWFRPSAVPPSLTASLMRLAGGGATPRMVLELTEGVLMAMLTTKLKWSGAVVMALGLCAGGAAVPAFQGEGGKEAVASPGLPTDVAGSPKQGAQGPDVGNVASDIISIYCEGDRFDEVVGALGKQTGLHVVVDREAAAPSSRGPVSLTVRDITAKTVLKLMLKPIQPKYRVEDEALRFATPLSLTGTTVVKTYYVGDLIERDRPKTPGVEMRLLADLIRNVVAPGTWTNPNLTSDELPKPSEGEVRGSITPYFLSLSLIVRHSPEVHDQVSTLMRGLRDLSANRDKGLDSEMSRLPSSMEATPPDAYPPKLRVTVSEKRAPNANGVSTHEIEVANLGKSAATGVEVSAKFSETVSPLQALGTEKPKGWGRFRTLRFPKVERIGPGETRKFTIEARAEKSGPASLWAWVRHDRMRSWETPFEDVAEWRIDAAVPEAAR